MNPYRETTLAALRYLSERPLCASPVALTAAVVQWVQVVRPTTVELCRDCGEGAAREVAMPTRQIEVKLTELE